MYLQAVDSVVLQVYAMGMDVRTFVLCCYIYRRADPELLKLKLDLVKGVVGVFTNKYGTPITYKLQALI